MNIDIKIPFSPEHHLAAAYNRAMDESTAEWVLLLDHDVFLACNPHWYRMCTEAIEVVKDEKVGLITCVTSGTENLSQKAAIQVADIYCGLLDRHIRAAYELYVKYGSTVRLLPDDYHMAGFFMLVNKKAWEQVRFQGMHKGVNKVDYSFCKRLVEQGFKIYSMPGLYVYHRRGVRKLKWER